MNGFEAIDVIKSWKDILIQGTPEQMDRFLIGVEKRFQAKGWRRDTQREQQGNSRLCFVGGPADGPQVMLSLNKVNDQRVRGGSCAVIRDSASGDAVEVANMVQDVRNSVLDPAASEVGLRVTCPHLGPFSRVPVGTAMALSAFADAAAGKWPFSEQEEVAWRKFLFAVFREDVAFNLDELRNWFIENGWQPNDAANLTKRFCADATLLSEYDDQRQPA